jgi:iron complex outermembrane receptor protein
VQTFNVFNAVNDSLGTLKGFEMYGEVDLTCRVTAFATSWYVEGKNHVRDEPLPAIFPWNSRVGVRLHEPSQNPLWAVEFSARIVDDQDRVSQSLFEQTTPGFTLFDLRAYAQLTENVLFTLGVENIFDRFYQEHLDPHQFTQTVGSTTGIANFGVYQPGVNLYSGIVWEY